MIYTLVFVYLSRGWKAEDVAEDKLTAGGSRPTTSAPGHRSEPGERGNGMNLETWFLVIYFIAMAGIGVWTL